MVRVEYTIKGVVRVEYTIKGVVRVGYTIKGCGQGGIYNKGCGQGGVYNKRVWSGWDSVLVILKKLFFISTQTVAPLMVATAMSGIRRSNMMVADAVQYGRSAVATIGIQSYTQGCLSHAIQVVNGYRIAYCYKSACEYV